MAAEQVYRLAARGVHPQRSVIGGGCNDIGDGVVTHGDDIGVGIRHQRLQVAGGVLASDGVGQRPGMFQAAAVDLSHMTMHCQAVCQAGSDIS